MAKRGKSTGKRYTGILSKRISVKLPPLEFKGPITTPERAQECARADDRRREIYDQQVAAERESRWSALFKLYNVPREDWKLMALRLAEAHVPGFKVAAKRGAKGGDRYWRSFRLRVDVDNIKRIENIQTDTDALRRLYNLKKSDLTRLNNLKKRLSEARKLYKEECEATRAMWAEYSATEGFWSLSSS
jgi:hypothetical protein